MLYCKTMIIKFGYIPRTLNILPKLIHHAQLPWDWAPHCSPPPHPHTRWDPRNWSPPAPPAPGGHKSRKISLLQAS